MPLEVKDGKLVVRNGKLSVGGCCCGGGGGGGGGCQVSGLFVCHEGALCPESCECRVPCYCYEYVWGTGCHSVPALENGKCPAGTTIDFDGSCLKCNCPEGFGSDYALCVKFTQPTALLGIDPCEQCQPTVAGGWVTFNAGGYIRPDESRDYYGVCVAPDANHLP